MGAIDYDLRWQRRFNASQRRTALKQRAASLLGGKCRICGYDKCLAALEFHHESPDHKDFAISSQTSWAKIEKELAKTILVCSNCHREIHAGVHPQYLSTVVDADYEDFWDSTP